MIQLVIPPAIYFRGFLFAIGGGCLITYLIWRWFGGWDA